LPVIILATLTPPIERVLDVNVRLDVELPALKNVVLARVEPILTVDVLSTTDPTVTVDDKSIDVALIAAALTVVLLAVKDPFTTSPFFTTKLKLFVDTSVPFPQSFYYL
jgi:hypothetical protein